MNWTASSVWKLARTIMSPSRSIRASCWRGSAPFCAGPTRFRRGCAGPRPSVTVSANGPSTPPSARSLVPKALALPLSSGEYKLLMAFLERPKVALSREQLLDLTKGRDAEVFDRSIDNQVSRLRRKIEADPKNPRYIKTVWGGGYMFTSDVEIL